MLHQTLPILGQLWQLFEVSQILEFLRYSYLIKHDYWKPEKSQLPKKYSLSIEANQMNFYSDRR